MDAHIPESGPHPRRRSLLQFAGVGSAALLSGIGVPGTAEAAWSGERIPDDPFRLGVASGDPADDGFLLWTRLAPEPLALDGHGGMPRASFDVRWEVAEDERFRRVARDGLARATPDLAHSVHPRVRGLRPGRQYFYRFHAGRWTSPVGRVRTMPRRGTMPASFTFASASCQAWYHGWFTAHRHLAADDPDLVFFLGDYIYEYAITAANLWRRGVTLGEGHDHETVTLEDYRLRYALTKSDPDLQAAHAAAAFVITPDDHEVQNNYADETSQYGISPADFRLRRAVAYRALYENAPLALEALPDGPDARLHRRLTVGDLATVNVLDTRQYRSPAEGSILGAAQERWLLDGLRRSDATWNVLAQQVAVMHVTDDRVDQWDGFPAERRRLLDTFALPSVANPLVLTGDTHRATAGDLLGDFADPDSPVVGTELITTSIASDGDGADHDQYEQDWIQHPWVKFYSGRRGYTLGRLTPSELTVDFRAVPYVQGDAAAPVSTLARFVTEAGRPGLEKVN
ncbi:alkaline phosphatase D family protein [Streptomyces litchfieldiae]|uniref:Alkaline phosphatase D family protein n=1 Tax=Streptomyces litchfieldiae TaxID=3075543 RepID=A0ABU2MK24_9ACTN|nr:alkaline phosphatase D family protein [Streptomyces sp. DSM 44938]MDT0341835.1 alkaline phosphatase D family protein [Streptomyces sp. DSM 44938]